MPTTYAIPNGRTVMDATLYTGTGSAQTVTNQYGFKPDLVWAQARSNANGYGTIEDTIRGVSRPLFSNFTNAEESYVSGYWITAFNSNGFSVGAQNQTGASGWTYVGWQWQAGQGTTSNNTSGTYTSTVSVNATAGFSIVSYTGTGSAGTVGHGLGAAPQMIISKNRSASEDWRVASIGLTNMASWHLNLDTTQAASNSGAAVWNNTTPTSTIFGVGTDTSVSGSGNGIIAYCWTPIAGFSQFGSYTGNGSTDGPFVYLGFRPKYIMVKRSDSSGNNWIVEDSSRNTYNPTGLDLYPNTADAEGNNTPIFDFLSNGIKIRTAGSNENASGGNYIYACFAENPFKYANAR